jgi:hypothetical protein
VDFFKKTFGINLPVIGVIHLQPLPGAPRYDGMPVGKIEELAVEEANIMVDNGVNGLIIENFRDMMFKKKVGPETISIMTRIAMSITEEVKVPIGICVLQSDALAALAIAKAVEATFVRIPYYTETYIVDAGIMESIAAEALRFRKIIEAQSVKIFADVHIKHGYPLSQRSIEESAEDAVERGLADSIIITGKKTGGETDPEDVKRVRSKLSEIPLIVGSGVTEKNLHKYFPNNADAVIIGTGLKKYGNTEEKVDAKKVREFIKAINHYRKELD